MERVPIHTLKDLKKKPAKIAGWVDVRRDHGKLIFLDVRDESGTVQVVVQPRNEEAHATAESVRLEWVVEIEGTVNERPDNMKNSEEDNGDIEMVGEKITVLNSSKTPPFSVNEDTENVEEDLRLKYRYLDLRTQRLQNNLRIRNNFLKYTREYLLAKDFVEIETPLLTKSTPEGARDFVVPSRLHKGKFYALPQSPQQYKQLLMAGGFEKYFQIARAIRDEDLRADRGFEHTQVDLEMSFVTREDILALAEGLITHAVESLGFSIKEKPFPRLTYKDAMEKYGADKFDMREESEKGKGILSYAWVVDFPFFEKTKDGEWTFSHNPFSMPKEEWLESFLAGENVEDIISTQYDLVCNGFEVGGGSIRAHKSEILKATYKILGYTEEEIKDSVGYMLDAFELGTPPHGGIALGVERNLMALLNEDLRDLQAFPMTRSGQTAVMDAPQEINPEHLNELGINIKKE